MENIPMEGQQTFEDGEVTAEAVSEAAEAVSEAAQAAAPAPKKKSPSRPKKKTAPKKAQPPASIPDDPRDPVVAFLGKPMERCSKPELMEGIKVLIASNHQLLVDIDNMHDEYGEQLDNTERVAKQYADKLSKLQALAQVTMEQLSTIRSTILIGM